MKSNLFPAALLACSLTACVSPYQISTLSPDPKENKTYWLWGKEYAAKSSEGVHVRLAYENNTWDRLVFNVEIENLTADTILVAPEKFYSIMSGSQIPRHVLAKQAAVNPETLFLALERQKSQQAADEINTPLMQATESLVELTAEVAGENKNVPADEVRAKDTERYQRHDQENAALALSSMSLNEKKQHFDNTLLRKTSLPPNTKISGQVYFVRHEKMEEITLFLPFKGIEPLKFAFNHRLVQH